jgi:hypothetical protein
MSFRVPAAVGVNSAVCLAALYTSNDVSEAVSTTLYGVSFLGLYSSYTDCVGRNSAILRE